MIDYLSRKLKEEIILFQTAVASGEEPGEIKNYFLKVQNTFTELQDLSNNYETPLDELLKAFIKYSV